MSYNKQVLFLPEWNKNENIFKSVCIWIKLNTVLNFQFGTWACNLDEFVIVSLQADIQELIK